MPYLNFSKPGIIRRNREIANTRQFASLPDRMASHCSYHWLGEVKYSHLDIQAAGRRFVVWIQRRVQVSASAKCPAGTCKDHGLNIAVGFRFVQRTVQQTKKVLVYWI